MHTTTGTNNPFPVQWTKRNSHKNYNGRGRFFVVSLHCWCRRFGFIAGAKRSFSKRTLTTFFFSIVPLIVSWTYVDYLKTLLSIRAYISTDGTNYPCPFASCLRLILVIETVGFHRVYPFVVQTLILSCVLSIDCLHYKPKSKNNRQIHKIIATLCVIA